MSDESKITRKVDPKTGRVTATRHTTIREDLRDIGRAITGFSGKTKDGRGGRQRRQAIDDRVDKALR